jgi:hypothetical protein
MCEFLVLVISTHAWVWSVGFIAGYYWAKSAAKDAAETTS